MAIVAVVTGALDVVIGVALAYSSKGLNETGASLSHSFSDIAFNAVVILPLTVGITVVLAVIAGTEGGRSRRLGILAGVLAVASALTFGLAAELFPIRY